MSDSSDDWRNRASCQDADPELWFPDSRTDPYGLRAIEARGVCWNTCPVRRPCLRFGLDYTEGIYGGRGPEERKVLQERLERQVSA